MKHSFIDQYSDRDSIIHRLDPRTKLVATLLLILTLALTPPGRWLAFALYFLIIVALFLLSKVPIGHVFRRSLIVMPFVMLVAIFIPFFKAGEVAGSYNLWLWKVSVTNAGLEVLAIIATRAWLSILSLIWLTSTTRLSDLLHGLEQLHLPRVMIMTLSFMYRYLFVLIDEAMRLRQARDSRNFGGKWLWQLRTTGNMIGTLFIRSYERSERVYAAMVARGFNGQTQSLKRLSFQRADACFGLGGVFALTLVILTGLFS